MLKTLDLVTLVFRNSSPKLLFPFGCSTRRKMPQCSGGIWVHGTSMDSLRWDRLIAPTRAFPSNWSSGWIEKLWLIMSAHVWVDVHLLWNLFAIQASKNVLYKNRLLTRKTYQQWYSLVVYQHWQSSLRRLQFLWRYVMVIGVDHNICSWKQWPPKGGSSSSMSFALASSYTLYA